MNRGQQLFLLRELVRRDFQGRYAGSLFGFLWSFAHPLWQLLLYSFVFSTVMKVPLYGERTERFWVFMFAAMLPWLAVQEGVSRGATAVTDNAQLIKKVHFPASILVLTVVTTGLIHEGIAAVVFVTVLAGLGDMAWTELPWLFAVIPVQIALTTGLALIMATVHVFFRDTVQVLTMLLTAWFFVTPIVYPMSLVEKHAGGFVVGLIELNPLTGIAQVYRRALYGGSEGVGWSSLAVPAVIAMLALALGVWIFRRAQHSFADEI